MRNLAEITKLHRESAPDDESKKYFPIIELKHLGGEKVTLIPKYSKTLRRLVVPKLPRKLKKRFLSNPGGFKPSLETVYVHFYMKWLQPRLDAAIDKAFEAGLDALLQQEDRRMLATMNTALSEGGGIK